MEFIIDYWYIILAALAVVAVGVTHAVKFLRLPSEEQMEKVREWLLFAVMQAERIYGSKTGALKLRYVYDLFLGKFDWLARLITFEAFSELVDKALVEMKEQLAKNGAIADYVVGENKTE